MEWISVKDKELPIERDIVVLHKHGIEAIHFFNHTWTYWYSGKELENDFLKSITHWFDPKLLNND